MKKKSNQAGASAVEFALVLPLLLALLFGIIEFSIALYDKAVITNASREAARAGVVLRTPKLTNDQIRDIALAYCGTRLVSFDSAAPTVTVTNPSTTFGSPLTVAISYPYTGLGLGSLLSLISGPLNLSASTVMNNE